MDYGVFVCPEPGKTRHHLRLGDGYLECVVCQKQYPIRNTVPLLFPSNGLTATINGRQYSLEEVQDIYDRAYDHDGLMGTDLDGTYDQVTKSTLLNFGQPLASKRVLDLGTGVGNLWRYAPEDVIGYAIDLSYVGAAKARQQRGNLTVAAAVGEYLPFPDRFFDLVIAADTIEHTFKPEKTLAEIKRVLKPGGVFSLSVPVPDSLRKWGWNQLVSRHFDPRFLFRLIYILLKRVLLFGKTTFQPIDRDLNDRQWIELVKSVGFEIKEAIEWPEAPQSPIVYLLHTERA